MRPKNALYQVHLDALWVAHPAQRGGVTMMEGDNHPTLKHSSAPMVIGASHLCTPECQIKCDFGLTDAPGGLSRLR